MIHVIAVITAKPGKRESILQAFRAKAPFSGMVKVKPYPAWPSCLRVKTACE